MIAYYADSKIVNGDVILTYGQSHVVELTLKKAKNNNKKFKVIIVDSKPKHEGKELLRKLVKAGISVKKKFKYSIYFFFFLLHISLLSFF